MAQRITLAIDRQNKTLVSFEGSISTLPVLFQRDTQPLLIKIVDPDPDAPPGTQGYITPTDLADTLPRVTIASQATGTNDDESTYLLARTRSEEHTSELQSPLH